MPPAQLGAMTLMEEWELVEDVPVDDRAGIMHNNAPSSIRDMLSQHGMPGHPQISAGAIMSTLDSSWHTIVIERSEKSEDPNKGDTSILHCH